MPGEIDVVGLALGRYGEKARDASATRGIRLLHVHSPAAEHEAGIVLGVNIFAGGYFHSGWCRVSDEPQSHEIIGRHGLLKPTDSRAVSKDAGESKRFPDTESSICVDKQSGVSNGLLGNGDTTGILIGMFPDLHLDSPAAIPLNPARKLIA
jgi:hypothetical protein